MNTALNLQQIVILKRRIQLKGLSKRLSSHLSYLYTLYKRNIITESEFHKAYTSTLISLGK